MATYLPNVTDYIPQTETFTPDYKFLSDVLDIRQDRYNTNYKHMNNMYGSVVHADLSRANNKSTRDQYTEHLIPKMKQIAGLDLSLQENVDSAKALFKPFYENKNLVRDLVYTKEYKKQMARGQSLLNSSNPDENKKYWKGAEQFLQFKMDDFVNATDEEAMNKPLPKWVDKMDLITDGIAALKELDMNIEDVRFTPNGQWKITQKNGSLLRAQPTGVLNKEGKMTYTDPAGDYIKAVVLQNPKMMEYYKTRSYVNGRVWSEENQEQYGGVDAALDVWINDTIEKYTVKGQEAIDDLKEKEKNQKVKKQHWDQYRKRNGIINASKEEIEWLSTLGELESIKKAKAALTKNYNDVTKENMGPNDQLTKAYIAEMSFLIAKDVDLAANSYASVDAKTEWDETKSYLEKVKQSNRLSLAKYKSDLKMIEKAFEASLKAENPGVPQHVWDGQGNANTANYALDEDNDEVFTLFTIDQKNKKRDAKQLLDVETQMFNEIVKFYNQMNAATGEPVTTEELFAQILPAREQKKDMEVDPAIIQQYYKNLKDSGVDGVSGAGGADMLQGLGINNWDQLKEQLDKGNSANVNILYDKMMTQIEGFDGTNGWLGDYTEMLNGITRMDEILDGKQLMIKTSREKQAEANKAAYDLVVTNDSGGQKFQKLLDEYGISIFDKNYNYKTETEFVNDFVSSVAFDEVRIEGTGSSTLTALGEWLPYFTGANKEVNEKKLIDLKPKSDEFLKVSVIDVPKKKSLFSKESLQSGLRAEAGVYDIAGVKYTFDKVGATAQAKEQYKLLTETVNAVQEKGTGTKDSFPVFNADAWYEGSDQYGAGSSISPSFGGAMDIANAPGDNPGEYQWAQFIENYLKGSGKMFIKAGDKSSSFVELSNMPHGKEILKQLYLSSLSNEDSDKSKESRLKAVIQYNQNIGGRELAFVDGNPETDYSGVVIQLDEKFANAYMDPIVQDGDKEAAGLTSNTLTVIWPKGEFFNKADNQPRHHFEDYLQSGVPVVITRPGGGKVIFRNIYEEGNVINSIQAEKYIQTWDADLHQYVDDPVDVTQIYKEDVGDHKGFQTWANLEQNTIQFLLNQQTMNLNLQAADKGYNAKKSK